MSLQQRQSEAPNMEKNGMYLFMDKVSASSIKPVIQWIMEENLAPRNEKKKFLTLVINSPGGDVNACFALIDTMKGSKIPIHTVGLGLIASCGFLMFIAGEKGHRVLTPNTSILSHQYSWGSGGKEHELYAIVKEFELSTERMINHYKKCIDGMTEAKIRQYLLPPSDVWLSAQEAKKLKICDSVKSVY